LPQEIVVPEMNRVGMIDVVGCSPKLSHKVFLAPLSSLSSFSFLFSFLSQQVLFFLENEPNETGLNTTLI